MADTRDTDYKGLGKFCLYIVGDSRHSHSAAHCSVVEKVYSKLPHERSRDVDEDAGGHVLCLHPVHGSQHGFGSGKVHCPRIPRRRKFLQLVHSHALA
ncbi:uncharacterized protein LOC112570980 isoform X2 [Pomacea canaliculata]|uniref:uncharacterized protein LOC112570980 isoform X2 n=1 Tax=Pomacea canaliculata TaxID=400727 RepID=UPI000D725425|nr:uncharacterized protein LOC112570980 isoform X2 [Pomacea canaliculata]